MRRAALFVMPFLLSVMPLAVGGCADRPVPVVPAGPQTVRTVRAELLNLLSCPSVTCSVVEDLHVGQKVVLLSPELGGWHQVRVADDGKEGYVESRFLAR